MPVIDVGGVDSPRASFDAGPRAPNAILAAIPPGETLDLGRLECEELSGGTDLRSCQTVTAYSGFAYDSTGHRMLMFGGGHAATVRTDVLALDLGADTLSWRSMYPSTTYADMTLANLDLQVAVWRSTGHPAQRHTYDHLVWVPSTQRLVIAEWGPIPLFTQGYPADFPYQTDDSDTFEFDPVALTWSHFPADFTGPALLSASAYDPVGDQVVMLDRYGLFTYDPDTHAWTRHHDVFDTLAGPLSYTQNMVYASVADRFYYMRDDGTVFELDFHRDDPASSTVTEVPTTGPRPPVDFDPAVPDPTETGWAYDDTRRRICGALVSARMYCFDPVSRAFAEVPLENVPPTVNAAEILSHMIQYDPVDDVFVMLVAGSTPFTTHTIAWRPR